jgi:hypothetical protein
MRSSILDFVRQGELFVSLSVAIRLTSYVLPWVWLKKPNWRVRRDVLRLSFIYFIAGYGGLLVVAMATGAHYDYMDFSNDGTIPPNDLQFIVNHAGVVLWAALLHLPAERAPSMVRIVAAMIVPVFGEVMLRPGHSVWLAEQIAGVYPGIEDPVAQALAAFVPVVSGTGAMAVAAALIRRGEAKMVT